ncbi:MAG: PDDEXK nuclease domain-containing protein, partial [Rickettsia endosymbiont of Glossina mortisans submortisans]|nr:PDDEXK nuclease domain-containing protein [Rickettsia endosymbiont of Glossina mortisans submortisans]
ERAEYGSFLLQALSQRLTQQYGRGFSITTLKDIRKFYLVYSDLDEKRHALRDVFAVNFNPKLSWIHYRTLMRISRTEARQFYEIEAINNNWSGRELERQVNSLLFDRLLKSKDKQGLLELSRKGQEIQKFEDTIKEPLVLEFLSLPETHQLVESKLEEALINNLQHFLLELGKGFAFIGRQKRLTLDGNHFYADLVFYHVILKCYVIIDLKTQKLTHGDLGQMLLYVNYFDQEVISEGDNPTIGLVLCTEKSDAMVKYTLGDKAKQIFASKYQFHLPSEEELETELRREIKEIEEHLKYK